MNGSPRAGEYQVIYADPPWRFATYPDKGKGRSAEAHYDCLSRKFTFPIPKSVRKGCMLSFVPIQDVVSPAQEGPKHGSQRQGGPATD